jgi:drug/metabolite transporter (DMT)-like permease
MENGKGKAVIQGFIAILIWSSSFIFVDMGLTYFTPEAIGGFRYFLGFVFIIPFIMFGKSPKVRLSKKQLLKLSLIGIIGYPIANLALFHGVRLLSAVTTSFMMASIPVLSFFASLFKIDKHPSKIQILGALISMVGSYLYFAPTFTDINMTGFLIALLGIVSFTVFTMLTRKELSDNVMDTNVITAVPMAVGGGILLLVAFMQREPMVFTWQSVAIILVLAAINTAAGYMLYNASLKILTTYELNSMLNLSPLGTVFLSHYVLRESVSLVQFVGILILIIGVYLVQKTIVQMFGVKLLGKIRR